jgi:hypothetical protein
MKRKLLLIVGYALLVSVVFQAAIFWPAYLVQLREYQDIFPLGWDPPHYAGYAKIIMEGNYMRPILEGGDIRIIYYIIAWTSLIFHIDTRVSTVLLVHSVR